MTKKREWTEEEDERIRTLLPTISMKKLARMIKVAPQSLSDRIKEMGLGHLIQRHSLTGQFKKGQTAHNKGVKMPPELRAKCSVTWFKKGMLPHNTKTNGAISTRKDSNGYYYKYIRIQKGIWQPYQRYVWEQQNGVITDDHLIIFKDGNQLNCQIENLEMISLEENMKRNTIHNYPNEIIRNIKLLKKLQKRISNVTK